MSVLWKRKGTKAPIPSSSSKAVPMDKADNQNPSHLQRAKYMRKPYVLVNGATKKCLQLKEGVKICVIVSIVHYIAFYASRIYKIKSDTIDILYKPILKKLTNCIPPCIFSLFQVDILKFNYKCILGGGRGEVV